MTPEPRPWKKYILTGGALYAVWWPYPPFIWNNNTSLGLILCILTWTTPHGLNVTSVIPPSIYSVAPGSLKLLSGIRDSFVHFSAVETFKSRTMSLVPPDLPSSNVLGCVELLLQNTCSRSTSMSLVFKMARKRMCPDGKDDKTPKKKQKKGTPKTPSSDISPTDHHGDSAHKDKSIGNFSAENMKACIDKINYYENRKRVLGLPKLEISRNKICDSFGLAPATVSKRMTGKVTSLGPALGGPRRGRVLNAGEFQVTQY